MKTILKSIVAICVITFMVSCKGEPGLEHYYVDNQELPNFTAIDMPTSVVSFNEDDQLTEAQKEAYNSIRKINFLGYKIPDSTDLTEYKAEVAKVKTLLSKDGYTELMQVNDKQGSFLVKYVGEESDDETDEVVVLAQASDFGFAIIRVLGSDMNPYKIAVLAEALENANIDKSRLGAFADFFEIDSLKTDNNNTIDVEIGED